MTKLARVIFSQRLISLWLTIFLLLISPVFTSSAYAGFDELIRPIPVDQQSMINNKTMEQWNNISPSVTFGDLLANMASPSSEEFAPPIINGENQITQKTNYLKNLIAALEATYAAQLTEFNSNTQNSTTDYSRLSGIHDAVIPIESETSSGQSPMTNDRLSPTPFIPIPTLIASVSELANAQPPTINYQPSTVFPTPTLTDHLLLTSLNNSPQTPRKESEQSTNNILDTLSPTPPKTNYTIALLGDSMTDTLGHNLPQLRTLLQSAYPNYSFALLNYGQGATDMESGLKRLTNGSNYLGVDYPPLLSYKPDILVVESFAYNHWSGQLYDLDRQWLTIAKIIDTVKQNSPDTKIILSASIAPNKDIFGDGVLNWPSFLKEQSSLIIKAYLQNMINFATSEHFPLVDTYHPTLDTSGNGLPRYISSYDHLHPSPEGAYLYSQKIVETIKSNGLIQ